jgi:hypothetical protein
MQSSMSEIRRSKPVRGVMLAAMICVCGLLSFPGALPATSAKDLSRGELGGPEAGLVVEGHSCDEPVVHIRTGMGFLIN